jgi:hypothetical protein
MGPFGLIALKLPDVAPIPPAADIVPASAGAAMAVTLVMPPNESIGARVIADGRFRDCIGREQDRVTIAYAGAARD